VGPQANSGRTGRARWAEGMTSYADALAASAEAYQAQEDAAADGFGRIGGR